MRGSVCRRGTDGPHERKVWSGVGTMQKRKVLSLYIPNCMHPSKSRGREGYVGCVVETTYRSLQHAVVSGNWIQLFKLLWINNLRDFHLRDSWYLRKSVLHAKRVMGEGVLGMSCSYWKVVILPVAPKSWRALKIKEDTRLW